MNLAGRSDLVRGARKVIIKFKRHMPSEGYQLAVSLIAPTGVKTNVDLRDIRKRTNGFTADFSRTVPGRGWSLFYHATHQ
jgi:hypothetical protein